MNDLIRELAQGLENLGTGAYLIVSLIVLLETIVVIGQFIPGSIFLVSVGFFCYLQMFDFTGMLVSVFLAHYIGEIGNYVLGRTKGRSLFHEDSRFFKPRFLDMAEARFRDGGARILIAGQFLGFLRPFISLAAGATHYSPVRFPIIMAFAAFLWSIMPLAIGFVAGASWEQAVRYMESLSIFALVVIPTAFISGWVIRRMVRYSGEFRVVLERLRNRLRGSQRYQRLAQRHPNVFNFMEARLSLSRQWGLGASAGILASMVCLFVCLAILVDVHTSENWKLFDLSTINLLSQLRNPAADKIFLMLSYLGSTPVIVPVAVMACLVCWRARQMKTLVVLAGAVVLAIVTSELLRFSNNPVRPDTSGLIAGPDVFKYSRDHVTVAFALFGSLYYWLWNHPGILRIRASLAFVLLLSVFLIGFSRIYFGVHAPSDVIAGFCLGSSVVIAMSTFAGNTVRLEDQPKRADFPAMGIIAAQLCLAIILAQVRPGLPPRVVPEPANPSVAATRQGLLEQLPQSGTDISGDSRIPTNIVVLGSVSKLVSVLKDKGWQEIRPTDFFTRKIAAPVFPVFVEGYPSQATWEKRDGDKRLVLRIWPASINFRNEKAWIGAVLAEARQPKWKHFKTFRLKPDIDAALDDFAVQIPDLVTERLPAFRERDLYAWKFPFFTHGHALLIDTSETSRTIAAKAKAI